jgi:anti-sigma factor RsiW
MKNAGSHLSDQQLLLDVEGELSTRDENMVRAHLHACWKCRVRRQELENAIMDFVRIHQQDLDAKIPPAPGPRALLKARIAQLSATESDWRSEWFTVSRGLAYAAAILRSAGFRSVPRPLEYRA